MLNKDYYKQVPSKNILNDNSTYLSSISNNYSDTTISNLIINSNLEDNNNIK